MRRRPIFFDRLIKFGSTFKRHHIQFLASADQRGGQGRNHLHGRWSPGGIMDTAARYRCSKLGDIVSGQPERRTERSNRVRIWSSPVAALKRAHALRSQPCSLG